MGSRVQKVYKSLVVETRCNVGGKGRNYDITRK